MPWFKQDDAFWRHPKVRKLGRDKLPAVGLWDLSGTWCADNLLTNVADGFVPDSQMELWDPRHRYAKRLVEVGLWYRTEIGGEGGYLFHDWSDFNPTKADREEEREAWRERQSRSRSKKKAIQSDVQGGYKAGYKADSGVAAEEELSKSGVLSGNGVSASSGKDSGLSHMESRVTDAGVTEGVTPLSQSPVPVPVPSYGDLGGRAAVPARASAPHPRCPKHINDPNPPPCRACGDARRTAETWQVEQATAERASRSDAARQRAEDRQRAISACSMCDPDGYIGLQLCSHDPAAADRAARGRAAVDAALNRDTG